MDYGGCPMTIHPDVSGRPHVILMLERLIEHINRHDGVRWLTLEEMAEDFRGRYPFSGATRPPIILLQCGGGCPVSGSELVFVTGGQTPCALAVATQRPLDTGATREQPIRVIG